MMPGHSEDFVQERAPGILKPTLVTGYAEGLTGKSTAKDFMIRHLDGFHFGQVARGTFPIVLNVGKLGVLVPIGRKTHRYFHYPRELGGSHRFHKTNAMNLMLVFQTSPIPKR